MAYLTTLATGAKVRAHQVDAACAERVSRGEVLRFCGAMLLAADLDRLSASDLKALALTLLGEVAEQAPGSWSQAGWCGDRRSGPGDGGAGGVALQGL